MLNKLYIYIQRHKLLTLSVLVAWGVIAFLGVMHLRFEEDITKVLPKNEKASLTSKVLKQLNFADKVAVVVSRDKGGSLSELQEVATRLADSVQQMPAYVRSVQGIVDEEDIDESWQFINEHLPLLLTEADYEALEPRLQADSLQALVQAQYKMMLTPAGMVAGKYIRTDPFSLTFKGLSKLQTLNISDDFKLADGFLTTKDEQNILFFLNPTFEGNDTEHNTAFVQHLDRLADTVNAEYKGKVKAYFFGAPFISVSNATQIKTDILTTVLISLSALYLLLVFFYRSVSVPLIAFIPSVFGVLTALATLYMLKGSISAISISLGAVLLGVTIDYSLHILTHYKAVKTTAELYKAVTVPILLSSITTAISFLCLLFVHSEVMKDLGIFAFVGIMVSALLSLLLIPHFYRNSKTIEARRTVLDRVGAYPFHKNKWVVGACILLIVVSFFFFTDARFDGDIAKINYVNARYKQAERALEQITDSEYKSVYAAAYGNSLSEALERNYALCNTLEQYKVEGQIQQYSSIGAIVLPEKEQQRRIARWQAFWQQHKEVIGQLKQYGTTVGFKENAYEPFFQSMTATYTPITDLQTYKALTVLPLHDFITEKEGFYTIANLVKLTAAQRDAFIHQVEHATPTVVIDRKNLSETFLGKLKDDILLLVNYSSVAIFLILLLFFKRIELVLLTLIPIGITGVVTSALMNWLGIEFNVFSMIVCTLVLGHSVDFSIFMTCALQQDYTRGRNELPVYKVSVLLASITTFLAIGTLVFAKHPALKSIAAVSVIGIFSALAITFVFYPTIYRFFITARPAKGKSPVSLRLAVHSALSMAYYALSSMLLSNLGVLIVCIFPKSSLWIRKIASKMTTSVLYSNPFVRKHVENPQQIDLKTPAVLIANHSSWLDTLAIGLFTHKISYMVNDWVWRSAVFGRYVRAMGFFPASEGIEKAIPRFKEIIDKGISLMIFPEGKRSESNRIHRFHKGAFLAAEQLHLPILPIYLHGLSEVQPKGDFIIYDGAITVIVGQPIAYDDPQLGSTIREQAKRIGVHFREEFLRIRRRLEGVDYLKKKLLLSYLYMDNEVVRAVKDDFKHHKESYHQLVHSLPEKGKFLRIGDDYGQLDLLLTLTYPEREIVAVIADDEKRAVAEQSYIAKIRKIRYLSERPEAETFDVEISAKETEKIIFTNKNTDI